jgi:hypothetical protein
MTGRRGSTLIEVLVATGVLVGVVLVASRAVTALAVVARRQAHWRRTASDSIDLLQRFARSPCRLAPSTPTDHLIGDITFRWWVDADSGRLEATSWPDDAPAAIRRGAVRSTLPCP